MIALAIFLTCLLCLAVVLACALDAPLMDDDDTLALARAVDVVRDDLRREALAWAREQRDLDLWEAQLAGKADR